MSFSNTEWQESAKFHFGAAAYCYRCSVVCPSVCARVRACVWLCVRVCLLVTDVSCANNDEPIEMSFTMWPRERPRNHALSGGPGPHRESGILGVIFGHAQSRLSRCRSEMTMGQRVTGHGSSGLTNLSRSRGSRDSTRDPLTHDQVNKIPRTG